MATLSLKSAADYKFLDGMDTPALEVAGVGMGEGGDYPLVRGEDVAFFWEAMNEIAAIQWKFVKARSNEFNDTKPQDISFHIAPSPVISSGSDGSGGIYYLTVVRSWSSRFSSASTTDPSDYDETIKHVADVPVAVAANVANLPIAIFGETGLPTFTRSLNYSVAGGGDPDPTLPTYTQLLRADIIKALYRDFAHSDGLYVEFYYRFSRAQAYTKARNNEDHQVYYTISGTTPTPHQEDTTTTDPVEYTGVTDRITFDATHSASWKKEHVTEKLSDGSVVKYTNTRFSVTREGFVIHAAGDVYIDLPTSTGAGATDIEIVDVKWWACVNIRRESTTSLGLDVRYDENGKYISRKEATTTTTTDARFVVVPAIVTKAESVEDYRVRYTLDVEVPAEDSYLGFYENLASFEGIELGMEIKAKAAFDASTGYATLGSGEWTAIVTDDGQESFSASIFRVIGYLKIRHHARVTDGENT